MADQLKSEAAQREERILSFWRENKIFEKTLAASQGKKEFIFYEGPPTANGKPGIHHLEARAFKDAIPRYKTMRGHHVRRKGGWDTHGLPVELQVEKKLGLNSKKAIEEYGIAKFNQECKESVWEYLEFWNKFTERIGYWVDQKNAYVTYHNDYIESVWNIIKKINAEDLLYKDYKVVPWCPRCGTALSSHELAQGYEDVKDLSVYVKFKIKGVENGYFLAWTTTPWTLPGNVALAVGSDITYVEAKVGNEILVLAKDRLSILTGEYTIVAEHKGSEMAGMAYEPLFPYLADVLPASEKGKLDKAYKVYTADFVNTEDGTGIVHTAVMYGQDDFVLGTEVGLPKFHLVNPEGQFVKGTDFLENRFVKEKDDSGKPTLDIDIIKYLTDKNLFFKKENYEHSYPHCWRCHTALIYYARDSWYISMSDPKIKIELIKENEKINWEPEHIREGRFGEWLREIKDWAISRERYWGTPLPVWICEKCHKIEVIGSVAELKQKSQGKIPTNSKGELDLHRPYVDDILLTCACGGTLIRTKEVMDVWLDSGAMPFAQDHYPFENKAWVDGPGYPADFISEAIDQTRGWFYTLHAIGILMGRGRAYKNVICLGHLLDAKGKKMSKSLGNIVDPWEMLDKYGADTLRLWMYSVNQPGESKNFDEKTVALLQSQVFGLLYNVLAFYELYRDKSSENNKRPNSNNILDKWILARLDEVIDESTQKLEDYKLLEPVRALKEFINDLSTWYLRRSRERIKTGDKEAKQTLYYVLRTTAKLLAPFAPLSAEDIWLKLKNKDDKESVHLEAWPLHKRFQFGNSKIRIQMKQTREIVSTLLKERQQANIPVRQPLASASGPWIAREYVEIIKDEVNIKEYLDSGSFNIDANITSELKLEGDYRELVRALQEMRKKAGLTPSDVIRLKVKTGEEGRKLIEKFETDLKKTVLLSRVEFGDYNGEQINIGELTFQFELEK